jgi:hypothetical protein
MEMQEMEFESALSQDRQAEAPSAPAVAPPRSRPAREATLQEPDSSEPAIEILVQLPPELGSTLPSMGSLRRRFISSAPSSAVYDWLYEYLALELSDSDQLDLESTFPRCRLVDAGVALGDLGFQGRTAIVAHVHDVSSDEDSDSEPDEPEP